MSEERKSISGYKPKMEDLDISLLDDHPRAQKLLSSIQNQVSKGFLNWFKIVKRLGVNEVLDNWGQVYQEQIEATCYEIFMDTSELHAKTIDKLENLLCQFEKLCSDLGEEMPSKIGEQGLSLYEEQTQLIKKIEEYEAIIEARKRELNNLRSEQICLCKSLGREPRIILQESPLPSHEKIIEFQEYIDQLVSEKLERNIIYQDLKKEIIDIVSQLNYKSSSKFENLVLSLDEFLVTDDNMKKLELFHKSLKELLKNTAEEISQLRCKAEELWQMLEIDIMYQDEFRSQCTGKSLDTLEAFRNEVKRCNEIRKANIKVFIEKLRSELEGLWKKCHCSEKDRSDFRRFFKTDCYNEDLLELHEFEINRWRSYYEENQKLLTLIEKHKELWDRVIELEENATGPNRYKNRGGKLLQEEKERNKLSKMIPNIEQELIALAENYIVHNHGNVFTTNGLTVEQHIANLREERENYKKLKSSARKLQKENTTTLTPAKCATNLFPSTSTAVTPTPVAAKRKILCTPNVEKTKKPRVQTPHSVIKSKTPKVLPKIVVTHATISSSRRFSNERKKRIAHIRRSRILAKNYSKSSTNATLDTTYSEFQSDLSNKDKCRSTFLPEEIVNTPVAGASKMKTPVKTPKRVKTPNSPKSPGSNLTKLSTCKSNLKLIF